jgi:hypothetical protein
LTLAACATPSSRPPPLVDPAQRKADPRICAAAEPEPAVQGSLVQPATEAEKDATAAFLNAEAEARAWGRRGWDRAKLAAKADCPETGRH